MAFEGLPAYDDYEPSWTRTWSNPTFSNTHELKSTFISLLEGGMRLSSLNLLQKLGARRR